MASKSLIKPFDFTPDLIISVNGNSLVGDVRVSYDQEMWTVVWPTETEEDEAQKTEDSRAEMLPLLPGMGL